MINLISDETNHVYGGTLGDNLSSIVMSSALLTAKKLSMVYCVGSEIKKELKTGVQGLSLWNVASVSACIFVTSFSRGYISSLVKSEKAKTN
jgi:hypothetical protein